MALFERTRHRMTVEEWAELISRLDDIRMGFVPYSRPWNIINAAMVEFLSLFAEESAAGEVEHVGRSPEAEGRPHPH